MSAPIATREEVEAGLAPITGAVEMDGYWVVFRAGQIWSSPHRVAMTSPNDSDLIEATPLNLAAAMRDVEGRR